MGKKGSADEQAKQARQDEQQRQQRIRSGTQRVGEIFGDQFTPGFFNDRAQSYINFATPDLTKQYTDANKQLTFALDRSGNLDSSSRADLAAELTRQYGMQKQKVADDALNYKQKAQSGAEDARSNLIGMLNATGDDQGTVQDAMRRARALSETPGYSPLSALFQDFTSALGQQAAAERAYQLSGGVVGSRGTGLFAPRRSVVSRG